MNDVDARNQGGNAGNQGGVDGNAGNQDGNDGNAGNQGWNAGNKSDHHGVDISV